MLVFLFYYLNFLGNKLITLIFIPRYFVFCKFFPFLQEFYIVLLSFLFNKPIVVIHFSHKLDMSFVHAFHVFLNLLYMLSGKLQRNNSSIALATLSERGPYITIKIINITLWLSLIIKVFLWTFPFILLLYVLITLRSISKEIVYVVFIQIYFVSAATLWFLHLLRSLRNRLSNFIDW